MAEPKTVPTGKSVADFLSLVENEKRKKESLLVLDVMKKITGEEPKMWGPSIVGFGTYRYRYKSGREGEWPVTGFSPRKQSLTLYIMSGFSRYDELLSKLGKFKLGKSCLYVHKIEDIDLDVLEELIRQSTDFVKTRYES